MGDDLSYRLMLFGISLLSLATVGHHRIQAAKSGERISRKEEARWLFWSIRLGGVLMFVSMIAYVIAPKSMRWAGIPLPEWARWAGAGVGLLSILSIHWTLSALGRNLTDTVAIRAEHTLVTSGPYRWVRHPYYVGFLLLVVATLLLAANWFIAASGALVFVLLVLRTPIEERKLIERFGDEYRSYMGRTGRFVPRFW